MSEACPLDLNYGHFGEPSYDFENHKWHFPRQPGKIRELKPVGPLVRAIQSPLHGTTAHIQRATERTQNIKDLTRQYPALQAASSLLPELAQVSEVVEEVTSGHDPTVSELLAIGEAVDPDSRGHGFKTVSIAAFAGGSTGESVRVVLLHKEKLGWKDSKNIRLNAFTSKGGEEGWWTGNGSPMQQLVFAEAEGRPTSWLAVRYHGAISVLRPQLRRNADLLQLAYAASNRTSQSRLSADHIVTLPMDKANGVPYSDVTFNPWYNQQIATIDQTGAWAVWDVEKTEKRAKGRTFWTINKIRCGGLHDDLYEGETLSSNVADGWGAVLWAGDLSTVIVAGRRMLAIFDIKGSSRRLVTPNLVSATTSEWILDVKRSSKDPTHVFVTTTFRVFWLQIASFAGNHARGEMAAGAKCLLSWRHFRDPGDISLSLQVADDSAREDIDDNRQSKSFCRCESFAIAYRAPAILVLLYSRLTGLTSVFAFHCSRSQSNLAPYASDPYILTLPNDEPGTFTSRATSFGSHRSPRISAIILKAIRYESPQGSVLSGLGKIFHENGVAFYQLSLLTNDLALSECLYAEVHNNFKAELCPPNTIRHSHIAKTPAKSFDEFIVPDGYIDREYEDSPDDRADEEVSEAENQASLVVPNEDPHTISFEWLDNEIHDTSNNAFPTVVFDESLELLRNAIEDKMSSGNMTTESLYVKPHDPRKDSPTHSVSLGFV